MQYLRLISNAVARLFLRLYCRLELMDVEKLPVGQNYILVANHASHLDSVCLLSALPLASIHRAFALCAKDYFASACRRFFSGLFCHLLLVERIHNPCIGLKQCFSLLEAENRVLILFPEGGRSSTGEMGQFKPGVGFLVAGTSYVVIPAFIEGSYTVLPKGSWLPKRHPISVTFGSPLYFSDYARTKKGYIQATREIQQAVENLNPHRMCA